ncbi:MAG: autotransporter-associated beta strand repeat-containing protein [Verrucomicrobia bacterium]|nr:autotransporter-associated beta strand repeat-containing protein [Verrucomicrobiota bacterium]
MSLGSIAVQSGTLKFDMSDSGGIGSNVARPTTTLTLGLFARANTTGATLNILGPTAGILTQQFNGLTLLAGNNAVVVSNNTGAMIVNLNALNRAAGAGIVNFATPGGAGAITTTTTNNYTGIIGPWAIVNGTDYAMVTSEVVNLYNVGNLKITNYNGYTTLGGGGTLPDNSNLNVQLTGVGGSYGLASALDTINTLRANESGLSTIAMAGRTLRLGVPGGILVPAGSAGLTIGNAANDGYLTAGASNGVAGEMVLINNAASALVINSAVTNNTGGGAVTVTVAGTGGVNFNGNTYLGGQLNANGGTVNISGSTNTMGGLVQRAGIVNINTASSFTNASFTSFVDSGVLNVNAPVQFSLVGGPGSLSNQFNVAASAFSRAVVNVSTDLIASIINVGVGNSSAGAIYQTGGTMSPGQRSSTTSFGLGLNVAAYGYYKLANGIFGTNNYTQFDLANGAGAVGIFEQTGGYVNGGTEWTIMGLGVGPNQYELINVQGGTFNGTLSASGIAIGYQGNSNVAVVTVGGSGVLRSISGGLELARTGSTNNVGVVNLNSGGRIQTINVRATANALGTALYNQSVFNFDGGTLEATTNTASFMQGLSSAIIYDGGAVIDSGTNVIGIAQSLIGVSGWGVTNIMVADGGESYIGAPGVIISGGSGTGATAYAVIDVPSGLLSNIVISSTGSGYLPTDALQVSLVGGGYQRAGTLGTFTLGANGVDSGLVKTGTGTLILTGTNLYNGPTTIAQGLLQIGNGSSIVWQVSGVITNNGSLVYNHDNFVGVANNITGSGSLGMIGRGALILSGTNNYTGGTGITNGFVRFESPESFPAASNITLGAGAAVAFNTNNLLANLIPAIVNVASSPGMLALLPVNAAENFDFFTPNYVNLILGGGSNMTYTGVYTPYQSVGVNYYRLGAVINATFTFTNEISDLFNSGVSAVLEVNKGGNVLSGVVALRPDVTNSFSGSITIGGGLLSITNDGSLGSQPDAPVANLNLSGYGGLQFASNVDLHINRSIYIATGSTGIVEVVPGASVVIPGLITNVSGGTGFLEKRGDGSAVLWGTAANTTPGNTGWVYGLMVNDGSLALTGTVLNVGLGFAQIGTSTGNNFGTVIVGTNSALLVGNAAGSTNLWLGNSGYGNTLIITNGGVVKSGGGDMAFTMGVQTSSVNNAVVVTGTNSLLAVNGRIRMGNAGMYNTMQVVAGATVSNNNWLEVGGPGSTTMSNLLYISDAGTLVTNAGSGIIVGFGGSMNTLIVTNGARLSSAGEFNMGYNANASNNFALVSGAGSVLQVNGTGYLGRAGSNNTLMVNNGGLLLASGGDTPLYVGNGGNAFGNDLIVDGAGTVLRASNSVYVGQSGALNYMQVSGGAVVLIRSNFFIGVNDSAKSNLVLVTGNGTIMSNNVFSGDTRVGSDGNAGDFNVMIISNNAQVLTRNFYVGVGNGANSNLLVVTDGGTLWANTNWVSGGNRFTVGLRGLGNGAIVTNGGHIYVVNGSDAATGVGATDQSGAGHTPSNNWMLVSGAGSTFSNAGVFTVGREGSGNWLLVNNGASFTNMGAFTIGSITNSTFGPMSNYGNSVTVTDPGTVFFLSNSLTVGNQNLSNVMTVANGATLLMLGSNVSSGTFIGNAAADGPSGAHYNQLVITGAGTLFTNMNTLEIGNAGSFNAFVISDGAQVFSGTGGNNRVRLGTGALASNNTMLVTGSGSLLQTVVGLVVGEGGFGNQLTIANTGTVVEAGTTYAGAGGGSNTIMVTDTGSVLQTTSLQIGGSGPASRSASNRVVVMAGGNLRVGASGVAIGASGFNGSNVLEITGAGSVLSNAGALVVGNYTSAFNRLLISGGGVITNRGTVTIGNTAATGTNSAQVTGVGSLLWAAGNVNVGFSATSLIAGNVLSADAGGVVQVGGILTIGTNSLVNTVGGGVVKLAGNLDNLATNFADNNWMGNLTLIGGTTRTQLVEVGSTAVANMAVTNFMFGTFQVGDAVTGSNAFVRTVDSRKNTSGAGTEFLAASNLVVAASGSTFDLNSTRAYALFAANTGTIQQVVAGAIGRLDIVNTFTNQGNLYAGGGGILQFSNAFINGGGGVIRLAGGTFTNFVIDSVLTNVGAISGYGTVSVLLDNRAGGQLTATGGVLDLTTGFWNAANYGALQAFGPDSILQINQTITNYGSIFTTNGGVVRIAGIVNNTNLVINNSTTTVVNLQNNGVIIITNGGSLIVSGTMNNGSNSSITVNNGYMAVLGGYTDNGTLAAQNGALVDYDATFGSNFTWNLDSTSTNRFSGELDNQSVQRAASVIQGTWLFRNTNLTAVVTQHVEVASLRVSEGSMAVSNMFVGTFMVGDQTTGSNAIVQLVDQRDNGVTNAGVGVYNQILAASNLVVALSGSILDWNNRSGFAYNLSNSGTMQWTNAGNPAGTVIRMDVVNTFTNQGTIEIGNGTALQFSNAFLNGPTWGILSIFNGGVLTNFAAGGVLTNAGTIYGDGVVSPAVANNAGATVAANLGTLLLGGGLATNVNNGTLGTTNGGTLAVNSATLTNSSSGRIGMMSGVFTLTGGSSNVVNQGTILGYGTNAVVLDNRASGSVIATGGVLRLTGGLTNNAGAAVNAGLLAALGAGAQLNVAQAFTNMGIIQLNNAAATFTAPRVDNAGQILGNGAFNAELNNAAAGVVSNDGTGGTLTFNNAVSNAGNMVALNNSSLAFAQAVNNTAGLIGAGNGGVVTFNAVVTNAAGATLGMRNQGKMVFNAGLTNSGTLRFDNALNPSTAIITGTLLLGSSGIISMAHTNDTLVMRGDFVNGSTNINSFNMRYGTMVFGGTSSTVTNTFEVASTNKGAYLSAFANNMALGTLNITNHISFVNNINNGGGLGTNECLYVDVLHLFNGATLKLSQLTIYVGMEFIYEDGAGTKVFATQGITINEGNKNSLGLANVFIDGGGQIILVPEPSTSMLTALALAALAASRRRRKS